MAHRRPRLGVLRRAGAKNKASGTNARKASRGLPTKENDNRAFDPDFDLDFHVGSVVVAFQSTGGNPCG